MGTIDQNLNNYIWNNLNELKSMFSDRLYSSLLKKREKEDREGFTETLELIVDLDSDFFDSVNREYQKNLSIDEVSNPNPKNDDSYTYYSMGISCHKKGEYDRAIEYYQKAIELNPKNDNAYYNMGNSYSFKEEYNRAIEYYQKAIGLNPKNDNAYANMGDSYYFKEEYDKALEYYQKAIELNPKNDDAYISIGKFYYFKEEYDKALEYYRKAIELNPKNDDAYISIGDFYCFEEEEYDRAIEFYKKAIELNPKNNYAFNHLDIIMANLNKAFFLDKKFGNFSDLKFRIDGLKIENFKQYKSTFEIEFSEQVNIIIGQNAVGKTSLLQAITLGLLKQNSLDAPVKRYEEYISKGENKAELIIYHNNTEKKVEILRDKREIKENYFIPFVLAYGSNFFTSKTNEVKEVAQGIINHTIHKNFTSSIFMDYTSGFVNPIRLLEFLDLEKDDNVPKIQQDFITIINSFLDDFELKAEDKNYFFQKEGYEDRLGLEDLSEGYRGNVLLITDILIKIFGIGKTIDTIEGIILIDEFDKHLHPKWQSKLVNQLTKTFPKIQFIMTTHNPMSILGRKADEITIIKEIDGKIIAQKGKGTENMDVSNVLLQYFDVDSVVGKSMQDKIRRFNELRVNNDTNNEEYKRLNQEILNSEFGVLTLDSDYLEYLKSKKRNNPPQNRNFDNIGDFL